MDGSIVITTGHLVSAIGALLGVLWVAAKIIVVLVQKKLDSDRISLEKDIAAIGDDVEEIGKLVQSISTDINKQATTLAVVKDRLKIQQ